MIKSVTIRNRKNEELELVLRSPEQSGLFIKKIDGIGSPLATINTNPYSTIDGSRYVSARANQRNIVFDLGFLENPTIEDSRVLCYKYFPIKTEITIIFELDTKTVQIKGRVESNDPYIFEKQSGTQISIICPDPYFYSLSSNVKEFSVLQKNFTFPFSNEDLSIKLITFGNVVIDAEQTINYSGEVPVGFTMSIDTTGSAGTITIYNIDTRETMIIDNDIITDITGTGISQGDSIIVRTIKGQKTAILIRNGESINILNAVLGSSDWFSLDVGPNTFYYSSDYGSQFLLFRINYQLVYEGI